MKDYKILFSNIGYAKGINGELMQHLLYAHRNFYCPPWVQEKVLQQITDLIELENPDICCFVEIDKGSLGYANFNQLQKLVNQKYTYFDIENKYGQNSWLRSFALTKGKSNAFMAKENLPHEKLYFTDGAKRLVYKVKLAEDVTLFFAHFSLKKSVRFKQLMQVKQLFQETPGEVIFLGDFNILSGISELEPLLSENLVLLNEHNSPTFVFHKRLLVLDLCICTKGIAQNIKLKIVPQPYSDHAALALDVIL